MYFSAVTYSPLLFSWARENSTISDLADTLITNSYYSRVLGWHFGDELYCGYGSEDKNIRDIIYDKICGYIISVTDNEPAPRRPIYLNERAWGNYCNGTIGDTTKSIPSYWKNDLRRIDYIMDSSMYALDIQNATFDTNNKHPWQNAYYQAQCAIDTLCDTGICKGYIRWAGARTWTANDNTILNPLNTRIERYRYLAYSSWVNGGQGIMFIRPDILESEIKAWLPSVCSVAGDAYNLKEWLMQPDAGITNVWITNNRNKNRVQFILKSNPNNNRKLLMLCNFTNEVDGYDGNTDVWIHFKDNRIQDVVNFNNDFRNGEIIQLPIILNDGHTLYYHNIPEICGRACLVTLN